MKRGRCSSDDPRAAMETARLGLELATAMGLGDIAVPLADIACTAAIETGDWDWALRTIDELGQRGIPDTFRIVLVANAAIMNALRGAADAMEPLDALDPLPPDTDRQVVAGVRQARAWAAFIAGARRRPPPGRRGHRGLRGERSGLPAGARHARRPLVRRSELRLRPALRASAVRASGGARRRQRSRRWTPG